MTEIEQLRADIEKLENAMPVAKRLGGQATCVTLGAFKSEIEFELAKLEAEEAKKADPWKYAKDAIPLHISNGGNRVSIVAKYAKHLEQRVAELEQHVAALKQAESIDIFDSKRAARQDARIAELEKQLASKKQEAANFDLASHCLSMDLKQAFARIAELKAELLVSQNELAKRPVVWCVRNDRGEIMKQSAYDRMAQTIYHFDGLFPSRELASRLFTGETEPYTGEQS